MSTERTTLSAQVDADTELAKQFEEYQEQNAMTSRSEAVRHLVRAGLEQELSQQADDDAADSTASAARDEQPAQVTTDGGQQVTHDLSLTNKTALFAVAYFFAYDSMLPVLQGIIGEFWAGILIAAVGLLLIALAVRIILRVVIDVVSDIAPKIRAYVDGATQRGVEQ